MPALSTVSKAICIIACHGGPADHFVAYSKALTSHGYEVQLYGSSLAVKKFQEHGLVANSFVLDNKSRDEQASLAKEIATCCTATTVITDIAHPFDIKLQEAFCLYAPNVSRFVLYDNLEPFVPDYSKSVTETITVDSSTTVLFANADLAQSKIYRTKGEEFNFNNPRIGVGYYPVAAAEKLAERRATDRGVLRRELLLKHGIEDRGQKIAVYFGGNNTEYLKALDTFLVLLDQATIQADLSNLIILFQQHPGAKASNLDQQRLLKWLESAEKNPKNPRILISECSLEPVQIVADVAFYYQTSMGPQFVIAGIPTFQIGHETYEDVLVRNQLVSSVTDASQLIQALESIRTAQPVDKDLVLSKLGLRVDWEEILIQAIPTTYER